MVVGLKQQVFYVSTLGEVSCGWLEARCGLLRGVRLSVACFGQVNVWRWAGGCAMVLHRVLLMPPMLFRSEGWCR